MATSAPGNLNLNSRLFFIHDRNTNTRFLVDTGAEVSVYPPSRLDKQHKSTFSLQAANNTSIRTYGTKHLTLNLGLRRAFKWTFIIAEVQYPILGIDFLQSHKLLVDVPNKRLLDTITRLKVSIITSSLQPPKLTFPPPSIPTQVQTLLSKYPDITQVTNSVKPIKHNIQHHIITNGQPVTSHPRRLSPERFKAAKEEFQYMIDQGI
jgi:cleavage and polyadenylation specificity factor subunit 1